MPAHRTPALPAVATLALALAAGLPAAPAVAQNPVAQEPVARAPIEREGGGPCGAAVLQRDTASLTGTGDEVVRGELQRRALLRDGPDGGCPGEVEVPAGATVQLLDCADGWCLVAYATDAGFVPAAMLERMPDRVPELR